MCDATPSHQVPLPGMPRSRFRHDDIEASGAHLARAVAHELRAALDDLGTRMSKARFEVVKERGIHFVLGIDDAYDVAPALGEGGVEGLGLVLRPTVVGQDAEAIRFPLADRLSDRSGPFIVFAQDDQDPHGRMVQRDKARRVPATTSSSWRAGTIRRRTARGR